MLLSQTTEYALRAMTVIAQHEDKGPISGTEIADLTCIPTSYLSKVLRKLVVHKLLAAKRGRGGGFVLTRPAEKITFLQILQAVDADPGVDHCAFGWGRCNSADPCPLHNVYSEASSTYRTWARTTTLAEVDPLSDSPRKPCGDRTT